MIIADLFCSNVKNGGVNGEDITPKSGIDIAADFIWLEADILIRLMYFRRIRGKWH